MSAVPNSPIATAAEVAEYGPWNPGVHSELSRQLLSLCTIFRPENVFTSVERATELSGVTGLPLTDLVVFRPERLALHELLVRVATELEIPDPEDAPVPSLGVNFRRMTQTILARYIGPHMPQLVSEYEALKAALTRVIQDELSASFSRPSSSSDRTGGWLRGRRAWFHVESETHSPSFDEYEWERDEGSVAQWTTNAHSAESMHAAACRSLATVVSAIRSKFGRLWGDKELLAMLATDLACNDYGATTIGRLIEPYMKHAADREGYRRLPPQESPIVMSTKGASASGKSTMRPLQRKLVASMGKHWGDFALISPDIFRRDLLDFDSLGSAYSKYGGIFTSHELAVVDRKLDRHGARNAEHGLTPHLLVDRFRFDSFAPDSEEDRRLLARLGRPELLHFLFMITPPEATVERAWNRGLEIGRYKPVDDLLAHNIEAYTGIPKFLFSRALQPGRPIHYEFLDNGVLRGEVPLTVAFGWSGEMNVLDIKCLLDIDRYRKIDVNATNPSAVYPDRSVMAPEKNLEFLTECVRRFPRVNFADRDTGRIYLRMESGRVTWFDAEFAGTVINNADSRTAIGALAPDALRGVPLGRNSSPQYVDRERFYTLGRWGASLHGAHVQQEMRAYEEPSKSTDGSF